jgi:hypothetical protein
MSKWYFKIDGEEFGPVEPDVLRSIAASGRLKPEHKVRRDDSKEWHQAVQLKGLYSPDKSKSAAPPIPLTTGADNQTPVSSHRSWILFCLTGLKFAAALCWLLLLMRFLEQGNYEIARLMLAYTICFAVARYNPYSFRTVDAYLVLVFGLFPAVVLLSIGTFEFASNLVGFARVTLANLAHVVLVWSVCKFVHVTK